MFVPTRHILLLKLRYFKAIYYFQSTKFIKSFNFILKWINWNLSIFFFIILNFNIYNNLYIYIYIKLSWSGPACCRKRIRIRATYTVSTWQSLIGPAYITVQFYNKHRERERERERAQTKIVRNRGLIHSCRNSELSQGNSNWSNLYMYLILLNFNYSVSEGIGFRLYLFCLGLVFLVIRMQQLNFVCFF